MIPFTTIELAYPYPFVLAAVFLFGLAAEACWRIRRAWAIPALVVYATIGSWYLGNMVMTGPADFLSDFGESFTTMALWQVILFLAAYRIALHFTLSTAEIPAALVSVSSRLSAVSLKRIFILLFLFWLVLFLSGLSIADWNVAAILWPPVSEVKVGMFSREGIGQGTDFLLAVGGYNYVLVCGAFGMLAVLAKGPTKISATIMFLLTLPYFLFDRARNVMLAVMLPGVFCYLLATWGHWWKKGGICVLLFLIIHFWFGRVMQYRGDLGEYRVSSMLDFSSGDDSAQLGLDMLSELCYVDAFIENGTFKPNWGLRYLAEAANIIPRTLWPGKPLAGYDYAYARGFRSENNDEVLATISTGMIGQGVANFGRFFGVIAAALLMIAWTGLLSRLWRQRFVLPRFLLFLVGCGLTFNMGRDITLLVLWPFVFGYVLVVLSEKFEGYPVLTRRPRARLVVER